MYAGFWKRVAAYLLDYIIVVIALFFINIFIGLLMLLLGVHRTHGANGLVIMTALLKLIVPLGVAIFYYVWLESSVWQATLGKKIMSIKVTDMQGRRISFWHSFGRRLGFTLSSLTLGFGYLMCGWTKKKQCLHDMLAHCLVVDQDYNPQTPPDNHTPGWMIACAILGWMLLWTFFLGFICALILPSFTKGVEKGRSAVIVTTLKQAAAAQQQYRMANGSYARHWKQLEIPPMQDIASNTYCMEGPQEYSPKTPFKGCGGKPTWALRLEPQQAVAWRVNSWKYRIVVPYMQIDAPKCQAKDQSGQAFCRTFNNQWQSKEGLSR